MLRLFDPRIAEKTLFLNPLTNSFNWEGEEDKKLEDLKEVLREMMKNPKNMTPNPGSWKTCEIRDFLIRTDHRPLVGLFKKPLLSIENEDLRDLVSQMSEYSFTV